MSHVGGLAEVVHWSASSISIDTIYLSQGHIPAVFLKGCGVPDTLLTYIDDLVASEGPVQYYSVFISYSHHDELLAQRLFNDLQAGGVRCWYAPEDLKIGDKIRDTIYDAIRVYEKTLIILSKDSVASSWVEDEVEGALAHERRENRLVLFPIRLDDAVMTSAKGWAETIRDQRHIGDFTGWKHQDHYQAAFNRLLRDLKADNPSRL